MSMSLKIVMYIATIIEPTTPPRKAIMRGSMRGVSAFVVRISRLNGIPRVRARPYDFAQLVRRRSDTNRNQINPRDHHLSGGQIAELEQLADDPA